MILVLLWWFVIENFELFTKILDLHFGVQLSEAGFEYINDSVVM